MDILNLIPYVYSKFMLFLLVFTRISALFSTFVLFRRDYINAKIIISLASFISLYVVLSLRDSAIISPALSLAMIIEIFFQFLLGFLAGFILNILFDILVGYGQVVSSQIGLAMMSLLDPRFGSITSFTHFYNYLFLLIFLFLNGHLFIVKLLVDSFSVFPIGQNFIPKHLLSSVFSYSKIIFSGAILLSMAVTISMLLTNIAQAVVSRFAPQFNIFTIGINTTLIFGLIIVYMTFGLFVDKASYYVQDCLVLLTHLFGRK